MKILIFASWYPDQIRKGRGVFFKEQAEMLAERGHDVNVIVVERNRMSFFFFLRNIRSSSICTKPKIEMEGKIRVFRINKYYLLPMKLFPTLAVLLLRYDSRRLFYKYVSQSGMPDIIHAHSMIHGGFVACPLVRRHKIPLVITEHRSNYLHDNIPMIYKLETHACLMNASKMLFVSESLKDAVSRLVKTESNVHSAIIGNFVHDVFFETQIVSKKNSAFVFCTVGNLVDVKAHDALIVSFSFAFKNKQNVRLIIVGEGPKKRELTQLIDEYGMKKQISLVGQKTRTEVAEILASSDCFVFSSKHETFGLALAEATASGLPVVSTDCGGPAHIVTSSNGFLVPVGDRQLFANRMIDIYDRYSEYDRQLIREQCKQKYGKAEIGRQIEEIYEECLKG